MSRLDNRYSKHSKFLHGMRNKHRDCVPPSIIFGHQLTMISQHQAAAREYLEAYKLMPDNPLVNLCVGIILLLRLIFVYIFLFVFLFNPIRKIKNLSFRNCFNQLSPRIETSEQASNYCTRLSIPLQQLAAL